jgi:WD40 repeat protein
MKMKNNTKILLAVLSIIFLTVKAMAQSKPEVYVQFGHNNKITSISFSKDGKYIATGSEDRTIKLWDILTGREIRTILGHSDKINSILFSPDSRYIASASSDNTIKIFEIETGLEYMTLTGHSREVNSISFSPDGRYLASSGSDAKIKLSTAMDSWNYQRHRPSFKKVMRLGCCCIVPYDE